MFIGRENELAKLNAELIKPSAAVMLYGNRRVGKTSLILESVKKSHDKTIYFECLAGTLRYNTLKFCEKMEEIGVKADSEKITDLIDAFKVLDTIGERFNVVIDEYPYLKISSKPEFVDSVFQNIIDNHIKNIRLIICGSHIGMMKNLLRSDNALFGRFSLIMELEEWDYVEASECYKNMSPYDKVAFYSVFGGSPYINTSIIPEISLEENIKNIYLKKGAIGLQYAELLLTTSQTGLKGDIETILDAIGNNRKKYTEIKNITKIENDNTFNIQIRNAMFLGLVDKNYPINDPNNNKQAWYEITNNVMRFYYTFLYKKAENIYKLGPDEFYKTHIEPKLTDFISRRFEDICLKFFSIQAHNGKLPGVMAIGRYSYNDSIKKRSGEFDVVLKHKFSFDIYEVKYYKTPVTSKVIREEIEQIKELEWMNIDKVGFISVNGFVDDCEGLLITGEDLYK
ncbi:MAG: AAA family ATPase [Clostridia bacterium]|nr:AAA family ATPase [Clostridia bacterium]